MCVTTVIVDLYESLLATTSYRRTAVFGKFELATEGTLLSTSRSEHGQHVRDRVFDYAEQIALAIRVANQ